MPAPEAAEGGPYSAAIAAGKCPLCLGSGQLQPLTMCLHDGPLHQEGDPCCLCQGSGSWPPPGDPDGPAGEDGPPC